MPDFDALQQRIGYQFKDAGLLKLALTHPSVAQELGKAATHNQRLEFLGDAVLGMVLACELYDKFPEANEGSLSNARAHMINRHALAEQGRRLELEKDLIVSRAEEANNGRTRASALSDAYEALLGAIFLDGGYECASEFILRCFHDTVGELDSIPTLLNPKGELQELLQARSNEAPQYTMAAATGPDHDRVFECVVTHSGKELGRGHGKSKQAAESQAAVAALKLMRGQGPSNQPG